MQEMVAIFTALLLPIFGVLWDVLTAGYKAFRFVRKFAELEKQEVMTIPEYLFVGPEDFVKPKDNDLEMKS